MQETLPWYVSKRAEAFVFYLLAERPLTVKRLESDLGADFVVETLKDGRATGNKVAIAVLAFDEFPTQAELEREINSRIPPGKKKSWPVVVFAVQVKKLAALYSWLLKPCVEKGKPLLFPPEERKWKKLDDKAMDEILARVDEYWDCTKGRTGKHLRNS